jgi:hypothetical protein
MRQSLWMIGLLVFLFLGWLIGVTLTQDIFNRQASGSPTAVSSPIKMEKTTMQKKILSGAIPVDLDIRLQRRDTTALPPKALIRLQVINRGKNPALNYRWLVYEDGSFFLAKHSGDTSGDYRIPFDTELPTEPTTRLPASTVKSIKQNLEQVHFLEQAPYHVDNSVDDGGFYVITARVNGKVHEVIYEAAVTPLVEFLETIQPE